MTLESYHQGPVSCQTNKRKTEYEIAMEVKLDSVDTTKTWSWIRGNYKIRQPRHQIPDDGLRGSRLGMQSASQSYTSAARFPMLPGMGPDIWFRPRSIRLSAHIGAH